MNKMTDLIKREDVLKEYYKVLDYCEDMHAKVGISILDDFANFIRNRIKEINQLPSYPKGYKQNHSHDDRGMLKSNRNPVTCQQIYDRKTTNTYRQKTSSKVNSVTADNILCKHCGKLESFHKTRDKYCNWGVRDANKFEPQEEVKT